MDFQVGTRTPLYKSGGDASNSDNSGLLSWFSDPVQFCEVSTTSPAGQRWHQQSARRVSFLAARAGANAATSRYNT